MTFVFSRVLEVLKVHVRAKLHPAECRGSCVIVLTSFFALSRSGENSENPVL